MSVAICQQFRRGAIISHPDKHPYAPTWIIDELERVFVGMMQARDGMIQWLDHLKDGRTQAPREHQGIYFLEFPRDFQYDVLCEVRAVMDLSAPYGYHHFLPADIRGRLPTVARERPRT